jgi:hypothetical protein
VALPQELAVSIGDHHHLMLVEPEHRRICQTLFLSDQLCQQNGIGFGDETCRRPTEAGDLPLRLGIKGVAVSLLMSEVTEEITRMKSRAGSEDEVGRQRKDSHRLPPRAYRAAGDAAATHAERLRRHPFRERYCHSQIHGSWRIRIIWSPSAPELEESKRVLEQKSSELQIMLASTLSQFMLGTARGALCE